MVIIVSSLYILFQLPKHIVYFITMNKPNAFEHATLVYIWFICQLSTWSATCYNPFVYVCMSKTFRYVLMHYIKNSSTLCLNHLCWLFQCICFYNQNSNSMYINYANSKVRWNSIPNKIKTLQTNNEMVNKTLVYELDNYPQWNYALNEENEIKKK